MSHPHREYGLLRPPGPRLLRSLALRFVNRHAHGGKRSIYAELNLTSMVDMLTILVVFLLQTFSASGELIAQNNNVTLPASSNYVEIAQMSLIVLSQDGLSLNGTLQATPQQLALPDPEKNLGMLVSTLGQNRELYVQHHQNTSQFPGLLVLQIDQKIPYALIRRVVFAAAAEGYTNINFLVNKKALPTASPNPPPS